MFAVALATLLAWSLPGRAEIYTFTDKNGVVHFTNVPTQDERYKPIGPDGKVRKKATSRKKGGKKKFNLSRRMKKYDGIISEASGRYNIPVSLIRAVIAIESNYNPRAVSRAGAKGLMQLMPQTAEEMGVEDTFDPRQNILGGTRYLRIMANSFKGDLVLTLAAYNAGQKAVNRYKDVPPYDETQRYVERVLQLYYFFKKQSVREPAGQK